METTLVVENGTFRKLYLFIDDSPEHETQALSFSAIKSNGGSENICKIDVVSKTKFAESSPIQQHRKVFGCLGLLRVLKGIEY